MSGDDPLPYVTERDINRILAEGPESFQPFTPDGIAALKRAKAILDKHVVWVGPGTDFIVWDEQPTDSDPGDEQGGV